MCNSSTLQIYFLVVLEAGKFKIKAPACSAVWKQELFTSERVLCFADVLSKEEDSNVLTGQKAPRGKNGQSLHEISLIRV